MAIFQSRIVFYKNILEMLFLIHFAYICACLKKKTTIAGRLFYHYVWKSRKFLFLNCFGNACFKPFCILWWLLEKYTGKSRKSRKISGSRNFGIWNFFENTLPNLFQSTMHAYTNNRVAITFDSLSGFAVNRSLR